MQLVANRWSSKSKDYSVWDVIVTFRHQYIYLLNLFIHCFVFEETTRILCSNATGGKWPI